MITLLAILAFIYLNIYYIIWHLYYIFFLHSYGIMDLNKVFTCLTEIVIFLMFVKYIFYLIDLSLPLYYKYY